MPDDKMSKLDKNILMYMEKWRNASSRKAVETGFYATGALYFMYSLKNFKNTKQYPLLNSLQRGKIQAMLVTFSTGLFYLAACRYTETSIYHPSKTLSEQLKEETDWLINVKGKLFRNKPKTGDKDS